MKQDEDMRKQFYKEKVLAPLEEYSYLGEATNEMGTRLIGHAPLVAPRAYVNIVYAPLKRTSFPEFEERLLRPIPAQYRDFLLHANGLSVFSGALRVMGYVPLKPTAGQGIHGYPSNIIRPNVSARIKGLRPDEVIVGWYRSDGSYVSIQEGGIVVRFDAANSGGVIQEWADFDTWLYSEISMLNQAYKAGEISVFVPTSAETVSASLVIQPENR